MLLVRRNAGKLPVSQKRTFLRLLFRRKERCHLDMFVNGPGWRRACAPGSHLGEAWRFMMYGLSRYN